jgi:cytochrome c oxidase cbb3-type subunit I
MNTTSSSAYNYKVVRQFAIMTVVWGIVGMGVGVFIAAQLAWPELNLEPTVDQLWAFAPAAHQRGYFRLRRCALFRLQLLRGAAHLAGHPVCTQAGSLYFLGLAAGHCLGCITLPLGWTSSKEYAELEWPIDILITVVWVSYAIVFFGTVAKRAR